HNAPDRRRLLADADVDTDDASAFLVDDRVDGDRRLARAAVADDQLALAAADRDHGVDGLDARLQRLLHGLADDDAGRLALHLARVLRVDRAVAVDRTSERIDDAADQLWSYGHLEHAGGTANLVAFLELEVVAQDDGADVVFFEVEREGGDLLAGLGGRDFEHFAGHGLLEAVNAGDAVLHFEYRTDFLNIEGAEIGGFD